MTGPVPLGRLVVEERVLPEQGGAPVTVAPSGDGSTLVMTAGRAVAVMDLGEGEPEWRAVAVPAGLLADPSGADRPEAFAWGPFVALLAPSGMLLLLDHTGEVRVTVPVPAGSKVLDAWGDRLALWSGDRERIGLYRLRSQGGAPHLEVVVPPSRGVRELFPGVGPVVHALLGPGPEVVHLFGGAGPVAHPFRVACGRRPERLGPPVDLPFEPGGFERWLRLGGRTFAVAHAISVSLLDPARGLLAVHPSRPPLLNRPMVSFLARARPSSLKAVAVALAAADRLWQVPLPIGEEDDGRERLAAPLALLWPGVPVEAGGKLPSTRARVTPSVGEALGVLGEDRGPVARLLLAAYRRAAGLAAGTGDLEELLEPGALRPFEDLRFLVLPWLPWERAEALAPALDRRRAPCWLAWTLGWFDGEAEG